MKRFVAGLIALFMFTMLFISCGWNQQACASELVFKPSGGSSSGGASSGGRSSGGASSGGGGSKSAGGGSSGGRSSSGGAPKTPSGKPAAGATGAGKSSSQTAASKSSRPGAKPDAASISQAKNEAPKTVTRGGSYTSSVTNNTYVWHSQPYFTSIGYPVSIYNPFFMYNYFYVIPGMPVSPFFGMPFHYAASCGGPEKTLTKENVNTNNINITVDQDGKVTKAEDKNNYDSDLTEKVEADDAPPVADDAPPTEGG